MKKAVVFFIMTLIGTMGVAQKSDSFAWLVGTWKINTGKGVVVEQWKCLNDSTYRGKSMFVRAAGDSTLQETLELSKRKREWYYTSTVVGQNNNRPVSFKISFLGREEFISENHAHDFPQRIAYRRLGNSLFASIEGKKNEKLSKRNFDFTIE
jgi:hypothetical protein